MGARKKYKKVTEKMRMLQISNNAISEPIIQAMQPYIAFSDVDSTLGDVIYSGLVFDEIIDTVRMEIDTSEPISIPLKYHKELKRLNKLCSDYDYLMVIDNPKK
jgi:hypothetical protein|tara:strand:- start:6892 stop:7203 length:312 start_codon:yes stop_codon:yes gene_type:complete